MITAEFAKLLSCPIDGQPLALSDDGLYLVTSQGNRRYPIENDIAMLLAEYAEELDKAPLVNNEN